MEIMERWIGGFRSWGRAAEIDPGLGCSRAGIRASTPADKALVEDDYDIAL